jgi:hypothetical protein
MHRHRFATHVFEFALRRFTTHRHTRHASIWCTTCNIETHANLHQEHDEDQGDEEEEGGPGGGGGSSRREEAGGCIGGGGRRRIEEQEVGRGVGRRGMGRSGTGQGKEKGTHFQENVKHINQIMFQKLERIQNIPRSFETCRSHTRSTQNFPKNPKIKGNSP